MDDINIHAPETLGKMAELIRAWGLNNVDMMTIVFAWAMLKDQYSEAFDAIALQADKLRCKYMGVQDDKT